MDAVLHLLVVDTTAARCLEQACQAAVLWCRPLVPFFTTLLTTTDTTAEHLVQSHALAVLLLAVELQPAGQCFSASAVHPYWCQIGRCRGGLLRRFGCIGIQVFAATAANFSRHLFAIMGADAHACQHICWLMTLLTPSIVTGN